MLWRGLGSNRMVSHAQKIMAMRNLHPPEAVIGTDVGLTIPGTNVPVDERRETNVKNSVVV